MDNIWQGLADERKKNNIDITSVDQDGKPNWYVSSINMKDVWAKLNTEQFKFVNNHICSNTGFSYNEDALWDVIGIKPYSIKAYFPFECRMMPWANDRIRTQYYGGVGRIYKGRAWNTSDHTVGYHPSQDWDTHDKNKYDCKGQGCVNITEIVSLKRASFFKSGFLFTHTKEFDGFTVMFILFHTNDFDKPEKGKYYGHKEQDWNFPTP